MEQPSCLEYRLETQPGQDVGFSVLAALTQGQASDVRSSTSTPLLHMKGVGKGQGASSGPGISGELELPAGWARVELDNAHSWVYARSGSATLALALTQTTLTLTPSLSLTSTPTPTPTPTPHPRQVRSKRLGYSLVCTPLETKQRRDAALASLRLLAADLEALQASGASLALERASLAARTAEAGHALLRRQAQQQALRELRLEFGATAQGGAAAMGEQAAPLAAATAAALSSAEAALQALTAEGSALAARDEPGRRQRAALLRQMEELLSGMDAGTAEKAGPCSF